MSIGHFAIKEIQEGLCEGGLKLKLSRQPRWKRLPENTSTIGKPQQ
jgi:hypothetical protein